MEIMNQKDFILPKHIAFIMDGNGRWAKQRMMPRTYGHTQGVKRVKEIALACSQLGIEAMTVYAFSTENWKRSTDEVSFLFKLPKQFFKLYINELIKENILISYIGHLESLPSDTQKVILDAIDLTKMNTGMKLCFALNYGSRDEITCATKAIATQVKAGELQIEDIDEASLASHLMTSFLPDVDFLIRTSGEIRLSNFMLWQLAYAELCFTKTFWPDFDQAALHDALIEFNQRQRRFGGV